MRYSKENLVIIVESSNNYSEVVRKLGLNSTYGNRQTVKKYIEIFEINTNHFRKVCGGKKHIKLNLNEILIENSQYSSTTSLKNKLYNEGLKERKCELCGQDENWNGKQMSLILDHINGVNNDNRIENLRIVCPNCNATLSTHGGKNIKNKYKYDIVKKNCECGEEINGNSKLCVKCSHIKQRKVERPSYIQLMDDINILGYVKTGKKYGVSDNAIRKWKKRYEINFKK